ncbi:hypothetical protein HDU67_003849, partial [Dinochytrium kinnereticum]
MDLSLSIKFLLMLATPHKTPFRAVTTSAAMNVSIVLFRNDLRFHDNPVLNAAALQKGCTHLLPIYVFDPRQFDLSKMGMGFEAPLTWHFKFPKCSIHRSRFILESVQDLKKTLRSKNSNLLIGYGHPETIIPSLIEKIRTAAPSSKITGVFLQEEVTYEETFVESNLRKSLNRLNVPLKTIWGSTVIHRDDLPFPIDQVPDVFTQFRKRVEGLGDEGVRPLIDMLKSLPPVPLSLGLDSIGPQDIGKLTSLVLGNALKDERTAFPFSGGETSGVERVENYLWTSKRIDTYKATRNGLVGSEYSSK